MKKSLKSMIASKGPMTLFMTVSFADLRIELLKKLLNIQTNAELWKTIRYNPHIADALFTESLTNYIEEVIMKALGAKYYFIRFEQQHRSTIHAHICLWLKEPEHGICKLAKTCEIGKLAELRIERVGGIKNLSPEH